MSSRGENIQQFNLRRDNISALKCYKIGPREVDFARLKSKGEESRVRLAGDCNPWMSKMRFWEQVMTCQRCISILLQVQIVALLCTDRRFDFYNLITLP
jgi:hypothetical protein